MALFYHMALFFAGMAFFFAGLATVAKVLQLAWVIYMIFQAVATASENIAKCQELIRIMGSFLNRFLTYQEEADKFTLAEITGFTNNFHLLIGQGVSGRVYMGQLHNGREVAVKRLEDGLRSAEATFGWELALLHPLRHDHIVRLVGSCAEGGERMLVYEHMDNGTLRDGLMTNNSLPSWIARVQVLLGAARAIKHLHCLGVIHSNVTSSNILLDRSLTPRVSGFGASVRRAPGVLSLAVDVVQTYWYADPEYHSTGCLKATDVYRFGVVMLEVLTGIPPGVTNTTMLVSWALPSILARNLRHVLDSHRASEPTPREWEALYRVAETAVKCLESHGDYRPAISDVVANLEEALNLIYNDQ